MIGRYETNLPFTSQFPLTGPPVETAAHTCHSPTILMLRSSFSKPAIRAYPRKWSSGTFDTRIPKFLIEAELAASFLPAHIAYLCFEVGA
jgi:hypothetical protein